MVDSNTDGLLFTAGGSNEDNLTTAVPAPDGSWRLAVRDNGSATFAASTQFENDDFSFLYMPINATNLVGGLVTGFDAQEEAMLAMQAGMFDLVREDVGIYRLTIPGVDASMDGVLMLTSADPFMLSNGELAPAAMYLSYQADGSDFLINHLAVVEGSTPTLADGQFAFAYIDFTNPPFLPIPEPATAMLLVIGGVALMRRRRGRVCR
jgi:hypothetical protein